MTITYSSRTASDLQLDPNYTFSGNPYPYGMDPVCISLFSPILYLISIYYIIVIE